MKKIRYLLFFFCTTICSYAIDLGEEPASGDQKHFLQLASLAAASVDSSADKVSTKGKNKQNKNKNRRKRDKENKKALQSFEKLPEAQSPYFREWILASPRIDCLASETGPLLKIACNALMLKSKWTIQILSDLGRRQAAAKQAGKAKEIEYYANTLTELQEYISATNVVCTQLKEILKIDPRDPATAFGDSMAAFDAHMTGKMADDASFQRHISYCALYYEVKVSMGACIDTMIVAHTNIYTLSLDLSLVPQKDKRHKSMPDFIQRLRGFHSDPQTFDKECQKSLAHMEKEKKLARMRRLNAGRGVTKDDKLTAEFMRHILGTMEENKTRVSLDVLKANSLGYHLKGCHDTIAQYTALLCKDNQEKYQPEAIAAIHEIADLVRQGKDMSIATVYRAYGEEMKQPPLDLLVRDLGLLIHAGEIARAAQYLEALRELGLPATQLGIYETIVKVCNGEVAVEMPVEIVAEPAVLLAAPPAQMAAPAKRAVPTRPTSQDAVTATEPLTEADYRKEAQVLRRETKEHEAKAQIKQQKRMQKSGKAAPKSDTVDEGKKEESKETTSQLGDLIHLTGVAKEVERKIQENTWDFPLEDLTKWAEALGFTIKPGKGSHTKAASAKSLDFEWLDPASKSTQTIATVHMEMSIGALTLPNYKGSFVHHYLRKQIEAARQKMIQKIILAKAKT